MSVNLAIRGFLGKRKIFASTVDAERFDLEAMGEEHAQAMADRSIDMIEFEFLDEPDPSQRFLRFGTNPAGMVCPVKIKL